MTSTTGRHAETPGRGFTLLELIVVMVLISTVLAMAAPSLRGFVAGRKTADAAAQVLSLAQLARSQAVARGCVYRLNVDTEAKTYWLTAQRQGPFAPLKCEAGRRFRLPDGVSVKLELPSDSDTTQYIRFYPNGRSDEATIELTGMAGEVLKVTSPSSSESFRIVSASQDRGS